MLVEGCRSNSIWRVWQLFHFCWSFTSLSFFPSAPIPNSSLFSFPLRTHPQFLSLLFSLPLPSPIPLCSLFSSAPIPISSLFLFLFRTHPQFLSVLFSLPLPSPIPICSLFSSAPIPNSSLFPFLFRSHPQFLSVLFSLLLPSKFLWDWMKVILENLQCYW